MASYSVKQTLLTFDAVHKSFLQPKIEFIYYFCYLYLHENIII